MGIIVFVILSPILLPLIILAVVIAIKSDEWTGEKDEYQDELEIYYSDYIPEASRTKQRYKGGKTMYSEKARRDADYVLSGKYERDCIFNKTVGGLGSFLITFLIFLALLWKELWIFSVPIALIPALIASMIGMAIASKMNIDNALEHNVPKNHPRLRHDRNELRMCGIGAAGAAASIYHHGKKAGKELMDVEHWGKI